MTTDKTAVLVNGIYPNYLPRWRLKENLDLLHKTFEGCDFYYQCWDTPENRHIFRKIKVNIIWMEEPSLLYNPYLVEGPEMGFIKQENLREKMMAHNNKEGQGHWQYENNPKHWYRTFQILGFDLLFNTIQKSYDYFYRVRWDTVMSDNFSLEHSKELVKHNVVGYGCDTNDSRKYESVRLGRYQMRYDRLRLQRQCIKKWLDSGEYDYKKLTRFLSDFCIGFKYEDYVSNVWSLHEKKRLLPAEWGWYQVMNKSRSHKNVDGLVSIIRNVDDSYETYLKLAKSSQM